jgi:hypothetical protein
MKEDITKVRLFHSLAKYETFIFVGVLMTIGTSIKLAGIYDFSSDWFWLLAGLGLIVEGGISLVKQRRFDRKYKIIEINEQDKRP